MSHAVHARAAAGTGARSALCRSGEGCTGGRATMGSSIQELALLPAAAAATACWPGRGRARAGHRAAAAGSERRQRRGTAAGAGGAPRCTRRGGRTAAAFIVCAASGWQGLSGRQLEGLRARLQPGSSSEPACLPPMPRARDARASWIVCAVSWAGGAVRHPPHTSRRLRQILLGWRKLALHSVLATLQLSIVLQPHQALIRPPPAALPRSPPRRCAPPPPRAGPPGSAPPPPAGPGGWPRPAAAPPGCAAARAGTGWRRPP